MSAGIARAPGTGTAALPPSPPALRHSLVGGYPPTSKEALLEETMQLSHGRKTFMSTVFIGARNKLHPDVVRAVAGLDATNTIMAEFDVGRRRNVDVCVFRPHDDAPTSIIVTETKVVAHVLRGTDNGPWFEAPGYWRMGTGPEQRARLQPPPPGGRDGGRARGLAVAQQAGSTAITLIRHRGSCSNPWPALLVINGRIAEAPRAPRRPV